MIDYDQDEMGDGSGNRISVEKKVFLEDMSDQDLINELHERQRLIIITARCSQPVKKHRSDAGYMAAIQKAQIRNMESHIAVNNFVSHDIQYNTKTDEMEYTSIIVMLTLIPEERPI